LEHTLLLFTLNGLLGGLACALLHAESFREVLSYTSVRAIVLGAVGGYIYYYMFTEWRLPDSVMAFVFGYAFKDFVEALYEKGRLLLGRGGRG